MDNNVQYFNHQHILIPLTRDEHEEIICKACDKPILEIFYGCIPCAYYLHDECLNAPRSVQHPSHHSHPLTLLPRSTYPSGSYMCDACGSDGNGVSYSCAHCTFDLHLHCSFRKPSLLAPDLHPHELRLTYDPHYDLDETSEFVCDACGGVLARGNWGYCCGGDCDFGVHLDCVKENGQLKIEKKVEVEGDDGGQPLEVVVDGGEPEVKGDDGESEEDEEEEVDDGGLNSTRDAMNRMLEKQQEFQMMMNRMEMKRMQLLTRRW